jgi:hypothetical protein
MTEVDITALRAELDALRGAAEERLRALAAENAELRTRLAARPGGEVAAGSHQPSLSRRRLLRRAGQAAAIGIGATGAAALAGSPAAAADGDPIRMGNVNYATSTATTELVNESRTPALSVSLGNGNTGYAVVAHSSRGAGVVASGGRAPLQLIASSQFGPPRPEDGPHNPGELTIDLQGNLYVFTGPGAADWRRVMVAAPGYDGQAGQPGLGLSLNLLMEPYRLFDSRPGQPAPLGHRGRLTSGAETKVQVIGTPSGTAYPGVPAVAKGVMITLTLTGTVGGGHIQAYASGSPVPDTSVSNWWMANQDLATTTVVRLGGDGAFVLRPSGSTHAVVDVIGFLA